MPFVNILLEISFKLAFRSADRHAKSATTQSDSSVAQVSSIFLEICIFGVERFVAIFYVVLRKKDKVFVDEWFFALIRVCDHQNKTLDRLVAKSHRYQREKKKVGYASNNCFKNFKRAEYSEVSDGFILIVFVKTIALTF